MSRPLGKSMEKAFQSTHFSFTSTGGWGQPDTALRRTKNQSCHRYSSDRKRTNSLGYSNKITNLEDTRGIFHLISFSISFYHETKFFDLILYSIYIYVYEYIYIYIYIYNLHNGECASVFNALFKTRRVSAFAFLRGLNMQLLQSRNWLIV